MTHYRAWLLYAWLWLWLAPAAAEPIRILFIGNSYTYYHQLPHLLAWQASVSGVSNAVETTAITDGGATLEFHWQRGDALAALARQRWDYVVLQEQSLLPIHDPARMHRYVRLFDEKIKQAQAKTILYLTWARADAPHTQAALNRAYEQIAAEIGARVAAVGPAWALVGKARPDLALYEADRSHPTLIGSYLAAYVLHQTLFGRPASPDSAPRGLTDTDVAVLQRAARQVAR